MDRTWWRSVDELDDNQKGVIEIPTEEGNYLVTGPPGCGKTNILLLRAGYLRSAGLGNCVVLVFTRMLREFIVAGSNQSSKFPADRIQTHAAWTLGLLSELGQPFNRSQQNLSHDDARRERHEALERAINESDELNEERYDSILLDEVQDYWEGEVKLLSQLTRRLFTVGDWRQRIYGRNEGIQSALAVGCQKRTLRYHYRVGQKICRVADKLLPAGDGVSLEQNCQYDDHELPSRVSVHSSISFKEQLRKLEENLRTQVRAYPDERIGILASRKETVQKVADFLDQSELRDKILVQSGEEENRMFDSERRIVVSTIHSSKGTEFRCVHFVAADDFPYFTKEKAFTAVTRAKTTLDVYHKDPMVGTLESAVAQRQPPNLVELFE